MKYMQKYDIPVATKEHLKWLDENNNLISKKNQTKYGSRVGMLLLSGEVFKTRLENSAW